MPLTPDPGASPTSCLGTGSGAGAQKYSSSPFKAQGGEPAGSGKAFRSPKLSGERERGREREGEGEREREGERRKEREKEWGRGVMCLDVRNPAHVTYAFPGGPKRAPVEASGHTCAAAETHTKTRAKTRGHTKTQTRA